MKLCFRVIVCFLFFVLSFGACIGSENQKLSDFEEILLGSNPSKAFRWLAYSDHLKEIIPELNLLVEVRQNPKWHPEGSVFEHTMQVVDAASRLKMRTKREKLILMYAALCHDLGKYSTTRIENGVWRAHGHAKAGVVPARAVMERLTQDKEMIETVCVLVEYHMKPWDFIHDDEPLEMYKKLADELGNLTDLFVLRQLSCADQQGRQGGNKREPFSDVKPWTLTFEERAKEAGVYPGGNH